MVATDDMSFGGDAAFSTSGRTVTGISSGRSSEKSSNKNLNLATKNPFDEVVEDEDNILETQNIHLYVRQRTGRKAITVIQGLSNQLDWTRILKAFRKTFACNGSVVEDTQLGLVMQLQGDQRLGVRQFLIEEELAVSNQIKIHGT